MFFSKPAPELTKIKAPTAAEVCDKSKPSPEGKALLQPGMTPTQYQAALDKNKLPVDSVNFLAHGMEPKDSVCWACQSSRMTESKLSGPELNALQSTEAWLKNPSPAMRANMANSLKNVDYTGPGSWAAQAGTWASAPATPGVPSTAGLTGSAGAGAVMLAAGLKNGPAMPAVPNKPAAPAVPQLALQKPQLPQIKAPQIPQQPQAPAVPAIDQPKMVKTLSPFIDLGKKVANGSVSCT